MAPKLLKGKIMKFETESNGGVEITINESPCTIIEIKTFLGSTKAYMTFDDLERFSKDLSEHVNRWEGVYQSEYEKESEDENN